MTNPGLQRRPLHQLQATVQRQPGPKFGHRGQSRQGLSRAHRQLPAPGIGQPGFGARARAESSLMFALPRKNAKTRIFYV
jgi:hypothetical protein